MNPASGPAASGCARCALRPGIADRAAAAPSVEEERVTRPVEPLRPDRPAARARTRTAARRRSLATGDSGFTPVGLMVVVIMIGVLAAIGVPAYQGIRNSARDNAVKPDPMNDKIALVAYRATTGSTECLSSTNFTTAVLGPSGFVRSDAVNSGTAIAHPLHTTMKSFCISAQSAQGTWYYTSTNQPATKTTDSGVATSCNNWWN